MKQGSDTEISTWARQGMPKSEGAACKKRRTPRVTQQAAVTWPLNGEWGVVRITHCHVSALALLMAREKAGLLLPELPVVSVKAKKSRFEGNGSRVFDVN